jgi:hypothetical protein
VGLREFWNRLTGGDREERIEEQVRDEAPDPGYVKDYEEVKDDRFIDERLPGGETLSSDEF